MCDRRKVFRFPFPKFHDSDFSYVSRICNTNLELDVLLLVRLKRGRASATAACQVFLAVQCKARAGTRKKKTITIRTLAKKFRVRVARSFSSILNRSTSHGL